ncbi:MAG TPA: S41 family peptidase, partial [Blastocatellia bacterium]|nr:S41 family peptidase [Blastocatellia bacterium]
TLAREKLKGELSPKFGYFPPQYTEFETKRIANGLTGYIGYIRFNIFTAPVIEKLKTAISGFNDAGGIIFDLRGNPGGLGGIAMTIAGRICDSPGTLGVMKMRSGELKFAFFPQENRYAGPVAVLIDGMSASTSEIFSGGIQELGRAVIVGERSAGAALPSYFQKLPTGALFQFAIADFKTPNGVMIEGRGVIPDIEAPYNRASLLAGHDAQLEAAVEQIRKKHEKTLQK